ncbi:hypothetical protein HZB69_00995, partial [Candidatus Amesbacteria bacterium]|nr:hypothetical protein [Candidatus Amesbacteria bacterium]
MESGKLNRRSFLRLTGLGIGAMVLNGEHKLHKKDDQLPDVESHRSTILVLAKLLKKGAEKKVLQENSCGEFSDLQPSDIIPLKTEIESKKYTSAENKETVKVLSQGITKLYREGVISFLNSSEELTNLEKHQNTQKVIRNITESLSALEDKGKLPKTIGNMSVEAGGGFDDSILYTPVDVVSEIIYFLRTQDQSKLPVVLNAPWNKADSIDHYPQQDAGKTRKAC